jgi:hypothetical protein
LVTQLSLTHLELGVLLADHVQAAFAPDDLAVFAALLDGCLDFHSLICFLFVSERNSSLCQIIRRDFNLDPVAEKDMDEVHPHLAGNVAKEDVAVLQLHAEHGVGKGFDDYTILLDSYLFGHVKLFL